MLIAYCVLPQLFTAHKKQLKEAEIVYYKYILIVHDFCFFYIYMYCLVLNFPYKFPSAYGETRTMMIP